MSYRATLVALLLAACVPPGPAPSAFVGPQPNHPGQAPPPDVVLPHPDPATPVASLDRVTYVTPPGWNEERGNGYINLVGPDCAFQVIGTFPAQASLEATLDAAWAQNFTGFGFMNGTTYDTVADGMSAAGWRYRRLEAQVRSLTDNQKYFTGLAFGAEIGGEIAIVFGISGLASDCYTKRWGLFFHGLAFDGFADSGDLLKDALVGTWMSASATAGFSMTYDANGRYDYLGLHERDSSYSDTHVLRTTTKVTGDGSWRLEGRTLITRDDRSGTETSARIRIETEESRGRRGVVLYQVKTDAGGEYESALRR